MSFMLTDGDVDNADDGGGVDSETVSSGRPSIQLVVLCFAVTVLLGGTVGVVQFSDKKTAVKDDLESASGDGNNTTTTNNGTLKLCPLKNETFVLSGLHARQPVRAVDFRGCGHLQSIGASAFEGTLVTNITLPSAVVSVGASAFRGTPLMELHFEHGSNITTIGENAFDGTNILIVRLPRSVNSLGTSAFPSATRICGGDPTLGLEARAICGCPRGEYYHTVYDICTPCPYPERCLEGGKCVTGYRGVTCEGCDYTTDPAWAPYFAECKECSPPGVSYFLCAVFLAISAIVIAKLSAPNEHMSRLACNMESVIRHMQAFSFLTRIDLDFPQLFSWIWEWPSLFALFQPLDLVPPC
eukprot:COSAG01_NODE_728_length_14028_cov_9.273889_7_plen_356_part_00